MASLYATLSLTEAQAFQALGGFLQSILPSTCAITRGALNRVAEPAGSDFVTMMQIGQRRLAWNETTFVDDIVTGSIAPASSVFTGAITGFVLNITTVPSATILLGSALSGTGVAAGTTIVAQLPTAAGAVATYQVSVSQTVASAALTVAWGVLSITAFAQNQGPLTAGMLLTDGASNLIAGGTVILQQLTGSTGGVGTYAVSISQTLVSETLYAGLRLDLEHTEMTVQIEIHGPNSGDNTKIIEALFFSEAAVDQFDGASSAVMPLFCEDARQIPFVNDQQQIEWRYSMDAHLQINPSISTWQQFADQVKITINPPADFAVSATELTGDEIPLTGGSSVLAP